MEVWDEENMTTYWPKVTREDGRVEIICPHGVGHPVESLSRKWDSSWMGIHGCDGCCTLAKFHMSVLHHQCQHQFDRDGDLGVETCVKCGERKEMEKEKGKHAQE